jgi:hypothetical protein
MNVRLRLLPIVVRRPGESSSKCVTIFVTVGSQVRPLDESGAHDLRDLGSTGANSFGQGPVAYVSLIPLRHQNFE